MLLSQYSIKTRETRPTRAPFISGVATLSATLMFGANPVLAESEGLEAYNAYVAGLEKLGLDVENGSIDYDASTNTLTLSESVLSFGGVIKEFQAEEAEGNTDTTNQTDLTYSMSMSSGNVTITGLTHDNGVFSADSWVYSDDTEFQMAGSATGEGRIKIEGRLVGIQATNYTFTMPILPAEDPDHQASRWLPFVKASMLTSYDEIRVDTTGVTFEAYSVDGDNETLEMSGTMQISGHRMADASNGRVGSYSIDDITQTFLTRDETSGAMLTQTTKQGRSEYENIDAGALIDLFDPSVPVTGDERSFFGYGSTVDYESSQDIIDGLTVGAKVDRTTMRDVTIVKREHNVLELLDQLLANNTPTPEDLVTGLFQLYRSFGIADARANGISIDIPSPGPSEPMSVSIKEMAMTDINSDGIGEMMIVGVDAPRLPEGGSLKLDWAAIGDIQFADYAPMRSIIQTLIKDPGYGEDHPLEVARAFAPRSFSYEIEGLDVAVPGSGRTQIGKSEFTISTSVPPIPTNIYAKNDGIRVPANSIDDQDAQALLKSLGLDEVIWSDEVRLTWDEATKDLRLERLKLNIQGIGTVEASAHFANVPKELFEDPEGQGQVALIMAQFVDARISFVDDGVTTKGLTHIAAEQNIPEEVFRDVLVEQAAESTAPIQNEAFTEMVRGAVTDFLNKPGKISVSMVPENPVPLAQVLGSLAAPQALPDLLNVSVAAE